MLHIIMSYNSIIAVIKFNQRKNELMNNLYEGEVVFGQF